MAEHKIYRASTTAPVNIAVIKYWGKRDVKLNLPTNSSISVTLSQSDLRTHTSACCSTTFRGPDSLTLNSTPQEIQTARVQACLGTLRAWRAFLEASDPSMPPLSTYPLRIVSINNFPTAAGLASSAAGFAALVRVVADLYELSSSPTELSSIARQGSGSACRSLFGGYVAWRMGDAVDGSDSVAEEIAPASHWPDMRALILVVSAEKKSVGSTAGMQATASTSDLFPARATYIVPGRISTMEKAIGEKDFESFARLTMKDSNTFHATCLDTDPPIFYLNDISRAAIRVVESINRATHRLVAAYTFDAGPNAVIFYLFENQDRVLAIFKSFLGHCKGWDQNPSAAVQASSDNTSSYPSSSFITLDSLDKKAVHTLRDGVGSVILTSVGEGPQKTLEHLIDENGDPMKR